MWILGLAIWTCRQTDAGGMKASCAHVSRQRPAERVGGSQFPQNRSLMDVWDSQDSFNVLDFKIPYV